MAQRTVSMPADDSLVYMRCMGLFEREVCIASFMSNLRHTHMW